MVTQKVKVQETELRISRGYFLMPSKGKPKRPQPGFSWLVRKGLESIHDLALLIPVKVNRAYMSGESFALFAASGVSLEYKEHTVPQLRKGPVYKRLTLWDLC